MSNNTVPEKNKKSYLSLLGIKLFGGKKKLSLLEEEQMQSPFRTIVKNFVSNKLAMFGLILFLIIFSVVLIGPFFYKIDLGYTESSQINVAPGFNMLSMPKALRGNVAEIAVGPTFSVGVDNDGKVYMWGKTKVAGTIKANNIPDNMGKVVRLSAGFDHVMALNDKGEVFAWGNDRLKQCTVPPEVKKLKNIKDIIAGYQCSFALTEDGKVYMWGNASMTDFNKANKAQGKIEKVVVSSDASLGLTKDGEVVYLGRQKNAYSFIPENMGKVVDIAATSSTMSAVNDAGEVFVWGNLSAKGEGNVPEVSSKIVALSGGRAHYTAITESGEVVAWGDNSYKQATVPKSVKNADVEQVYSGYYQNYAITSEGKVLPWGLKGYLLGTDDLGRDIFTRLINGGRMTMTIGAIAVILSTIIGVSIGCISGFFGGKVDLFLQRLTEIISSLPFLPFSMILTSLIGNKLDQNQRILLIMVILGLLSWPGLSRLVRAQVLAEREKEFVTAAKAMGVKQMSIVFKHILPNVVSVIIVSATLDFATCMLTESTLSYLGFGVNPPQPTWGNMLFGSNNSIVIQNFWWRWVFTSIILGVCTICINLIGDGLRDAVDPKSNER